jgi:hypothetical protein
MMGLEETRALRLYRPSRSRQGMAGFGHSIEKRKGLEETVLHHLGDSGGA